MTYHNPKSGSDVDLLITRLSAPCFYCREPIAAGARRIWWHGPADVPRDDACIAFHCDCAALFSARFFHDVLRSTEEREVK